MFLYLRPLLSYFKNHLSYSHFSSPLTKQWLHATFSNSKWGFQSTKEKSLQWKYIQTKLQIGIDFTWVIRLRKGVEPACSDRWATSRASWICVSDTPPHSKQYIKVLSSSRFKIFFSQWPYKKPLYSDNQILSGILCVFDLSLK